MNSKLEILGCFLIAICAELLSIRDIQNYLFGYQIYLRNQIPNIWYQVSF